MNDREKSEMFQATSEEGRKKPCPSTPRDFFEKLYGHLDTEKQSHAREHETKLFKNKSKLLGLKIHQMSKVKHITSDSNQPTNWLREKNEHTAIYEGFVHSELRSDDSVINGVNESSEGEVDIESEDGGEGNSTRKTSSTTAGQQLEVRRDESMRYFNQTLEVTTSSTSDIRENKSLFARIPQDRLCWKSTDPKMKSSEHPAYPLHLPLIRSEEHQPFFLRPFQEGPYPPGLTAFRK